jgi:hypothetical protein
MRSARVPGRDAPIRSAYFFKVSKNITNGDVAELHATAQFTIGAPGQPAQVTRTLLNQVLVKSAGTWRVMSISPINLPAQ